MPPYMLHGDDDKPEEPDTTRPIILINCTPALQDDKLTEKTYHYPISEIEPFILPLRQIHSSFYALDYPIKRGDELSIILGSPSKDHLISVMKLTGKYTWKHNYSFFVTNFPDLKESIETLVTALKTDCKVDLSAGDIITTTFSCTQPPNNNVDSPDDPNPNPNKSSGLRVYKRADWRIKAIQEDMEYNTESPLRSCVQIKPSDEDPKNNAFKEVPNFPALLTYYQAIWREIKFTSRSPKEGDTLTYFLGRAENNLYPPLLKINRRNDENYEDFSSDIWVTIHNINDFQYAQMTVQLSESPRLASAFHDMNVALRNWGIETTENLVIRLKWQEQSLNTPASEFRPKLSNKEQVLENFDLPDRNKLTNLSQTQIHEEIGIQESTSMDVCSCWLDQDGTHAYDKCEEEEECHCTHDDYKKRVIDQDSGTLPESMLTLSGEEYKNENQTTCSSPTAITCNQPNPLVLDHKIASDLECPAHAISALLLGNKDPAGESLDSSDSGSSSGDCQMRVPANSLDSSTEVEFEYFAPQQEIEIFKDSVLTLPERSLEVPKPMQTTYRDNEFGLRTHEARFQHALDHISNARNNRHPSENSSLTSIMKPTEKDNASSLSGNKNGGLNDSAAANEMDIVDNDQPCSSSTLISKQPSGLQQYANFLHHLEKRKASFYSKKSQNQRKEAEIEMNKQGYHRMSSCFPISPSITSILLARGPNFKVPDSWDEEMESQRTHQQSRALNTLPANQFESQSSEDIIERACPDTKTIKNEKLEDDDEDETSPESENDPRVKVTLTKIYSALSQLFKNPSGVPAHWYESHTPAKPDINAVQVDVKWTDKSTMTLFSDNQKSRGSITVFIGPMFAGKTSKMIEIYKALIEEGAQGIMIRSTMDSRHNHDTVRTHDGKEVRSRSFNKLYPEDPTWTQYNLIGIDEGHFFPNIASFCDEMAIRGKKVLVTVVNATFKRTPFENVSELLAKADAVQNLYSICDLCGAKATATIRRTRDPEVIKVGGANMYQPLCRNCFCLEKPKSDTYITGALKSEQEITVDSPGSPEKFSKHMQNEILRLATFATYSKAVPSPEELARAGFFYIGKDDITQCAYCPINIADWKEEDIPATVHREFSPNCPSLKPRLALSLVPTEPAYVLNNIQIESEAQKEVFLPPLHLIEDHQSWLQYITDYSPNETMAYAIFDERYRWYPTLDPAISPFQYTRSEQRYYLNKLRDEYQRFLTFKLFKAPITQITQLAKSGFYYYNHKKEIQCFMCFLTIRSIGKSSNIAKTHFEYSADCPMVNDDTLLYGNITSTDPPKEFPEENLFIVEPLHNPSTRRHALKFQVIRQEKMSPATIDNPTTSNTEQMNDKEDQESVKPTPLPPSHSKAAFAEKPPAVFQDPLSMREIQNNLLNFTNNNRHFLKLTGRVKPGDVLMAASDINRTTRNNLRNEFFRLATFLNYNRKLPTAESLAKEGFFFLSDPHCTQCSACSLVVTDWEDDDDPSVIHRNRSPNCPLLRSPRDIALTKEDIEHFVNSISQSPRQSTCEAFTPPAHIVTDHQAWLRHLTSASDLNTPRYIAVDETYEFYPYMDDFLVNFQYTRSEQRTLLEKLVDSNDRFFTFKHFRGSISDIQHLARQGFYYFNFRSELQCAFCFFTVRHAFPLEHTDQLHKQFSPKCPIVCGEGKLYGNVDGPLPTKMPQRHYFILEPLHNPSTRKNLRTRCQPPIMPPDLDKQFPSILSTDAFSEMPPTIFRDPQSLVDIQERALNIMEPIAQPFDDHSEFTGHSCKRHKANDWMYDETAFQCCETVTPEIINVINLRAEQDEIINQPNKERSKIYSSINSLQTLVSPAELGWDPFFDESFWLTEQGKDRNICRIKASLSPDGNGYQSVGTDGIVYQLSQSRWVVLVPNHLRRYVTWAFHDTPIMGHYGTEKTIQRMKLQVFFPGMHAYVSEYISSCIKCQLYKKRLGGRVQYQCTNVPPDVFHTMSMDLVGPYPISADDYKYIMVVQDVLSRYIFICPLKTKRADEIAEQLVEDVFLRVGPPVRLLSDNAKEFHSDLMRRLSDTFGYKRLFIQTYRPQQNGANERSHAEIFRWMKMYMYDAQTTNYWATFKNLLAYTYNTTPHSTLGGRSPFEIIFGRKPPLQPFGWPSQSKPSDRDFLTFIGLRHDELQTLRTEARKTIEFNMRTSLERANRRLTVPDFLQGDEVIELEFKVQPKVVTPKKDWRPAYQPRMLKITEVISDAHVRVRDELGVERILHVDRLKRLKRRDGCVGFSNHPPKPLNDDENLFDDSEDSEDEAPRKPTPGVEKLIKASGPTPEEIALAKKPSDPPANMAIERLVEKAKISMLPKFLRRSDRVKTAVVNNDYQTHGPRYNIYRSRYPTGPSTSTTANN
jgi:thymidine kinase